MDEAGDPGVKLCPEAAPWSRLAGWILAVAVGMGLWKTGGSAGHHGSRETSRK